jgi:hypothetical protein
LGGEGFAEPGLQHGTSKPAGAKAIGKRQQQ